MKKHFIQFGLATLLLLVLSTSCCKKKEKEQEQIQEFNNAITGKVWFTLTEERWNTDFYNQYIPDSYRSWTYNKVPAGSENWFWYFFENSTSYLIHTINFDTTYFGFNYSYTPSNNSVYINFQTEDGTVEDYNASVDRLDNNGFILSHEYRYHSFERVTAENVTNSDKKGIEFKINPKNVQYKPAGPLIPVKE